MSDFNHPTSIIMIRPNGFKIAYEINSHMSLSNPVDEQLAMKQWLKLKETYEGLGFNVIVFEGDVQLPDMVFCANPIFSFPKGVILSNMHHPQRQKEPKHFIQWLKDLEQHHVDGDFEGMGDLLWCYQNQSLYGGYGYRTKEEVYDQIELIIEQPIHRLKLTNQDFYHLDTCLSIINQSTALYVESAFDQESIKIIKEHFDNAVKVDEVEAKHFLACNAHCPDGKNIIIEKQAVKTIERLKSIGLTVYPVDTSEFLKSGGSVFCMKHQAWL